MLLGMLVEKARMTTRSARNGIKWDVDKVGVQGKLPAD